LLFSRLNRNTESIPTAVQTYRRRGELQLLQFPCQGLFKAASCRFRTTENVLPAIDMSNPRASPSKNLQKQPNVLKLETNK